MLQNVQPLMFSERVFMQVTVTKIKLYILPQASIEHVSLQMWLGSNFFPTKQNCYFNSYLKKSLV